MLSKYYTDIMKIQLREFKRLSKSHDKAINRMMEMNEPDNMQSHTSQRYWQTHNQIEQCEKEMRVIIEELNELETRFHWLDNLHQDRFHFLTKDAELFKQITGLMDIYKQEETTMTTFIILAKRHTQTIQLSYLAENMRAAIDEFRLTYPKKHYTIIDCKEATNYNRQ